MSVIGRLDTFDLCIMPTREALYQRTVRQALRQALRQADTNTDREAGRQARKPECY